MYKSKEEGGLRFRDLRAMNLALLNKVLWRIEEKQDSLWIKWIHHAYLKSVDL